MKQRPFDEALRAQLECWVNIGNLFLAIFFLSSKTNIKTLNGKITNGEITSGGKSEGYRLFAKPV